MPINYKEFIDPRDAKALESLKAVPGFDKVVKLYLEYIGEREQEILNSGSYIKLGPNQLPEIYNLLPPICEKLKIEVPDLYLNCSRDLNANAFGETRKRIVINAGLLETCTLEEVQTCIAHECGHILCHHTLYHEAGLWLLNASSTLLAQNIFTRLAIEPLSWAFWYWIRCSEFSADRVSAYFAGGSKKPVNLMLRMAGNIKTLNYDINVDEFMSQADNFEDFINQSKYNKVLSYWVIKEQSHPLTAVRAKAITEWCNSDAFKNIERYIRVIPDEEAEYKSDSDIETIVVDILDGEELARWFKNKPITSTTKCVAVHCGLTHKYDFLSCLRKLKINKDRAVYQAVIDDKGNTVACRIVIFDSMNDKLYQTFKNADGILIIE